MDPTTAVVKHNGDPVAAQNTRYLESCIQYTMLTDTLQYMAMCAHGAGVIQYR